MNITHTLNSSSDVNPYTSEVFTGLVIATATGYAAAQILANIASLKIGIVADMAVDMGSFIYPVTFTLRDLFHKLLGKKAAKTLIWTSAGINLLMVLYLFFSALVPSDPGWAESGPNNLNLGLAFSAIMMPVWRIILASLLAAIISELLDTEIYHWFVTHITQKHQWARVLVSNGISVPIDTALFCLIAFYGSIPNTVIFDIFIVNVLLKLVLTVLTIPLIYLGSKPKELPV